jgi:hypothetical protein
MINELSRAQMSLTKIQDYLLDLASKVGEDFLNNYLDELKRANMGEELYKLPVYGSRFLINAPPGMSSGRISLKKPLAEERVQEIAEYNGVIIEFDDDVTIALYGDKIDVQHGLKEMAPFFLE